MIINDAAAQRNCMMLTSQINTPLSSDFLS
jgi:hypothetical protein